MPAKYTHSLRITEEAYEYFAECGRFGQTQADLLIQVCQHFIATTHKNDEGQFDGGTKILARLWAKYHTNGGA